MVLQQCLGKGFLVHCDLFSEGLEEFLGDVGDLGANLTQLFYFLMQSVLPIIEFEYHVLDPVSESPDLVLDLELHGGDWNYTVRLIFVEVVSVHTENAHQSFVLLAVEIQCLVGMDGTSSIRLLLYSIDHTLHFVLAHSQLFLRESLVAIVEIEHGVDLLEVGEEIGSLFGFGEVTGFVEGFVFLVWVEDADDLIDDLRTALA